MLLTTKRLNIWTCTQFSHQHITYTGTKLMPTPALHTRTQDEHTEASRQQLIGAEETQRWEWVEFALGAQVSACAFDMHTQTPHTHYRSLLHSLTVIRPHHPLSVTRPLAYSLNYPLRKHGVSELTESGQQRLVFVPGTGDRMHISIKAECDIYMDVSYLFVCASACVLVHVCVRCEILFINFEMPPLTLFLWLA